MKKICRAGRFYSLHPSAAVSNLPVSEYDELRRGQFINTHGAESMKLGGADTNFGAQSQLPTVVKTGGGIDQNHRGIDFPYKPPRTLVVLGHDGFGMV